MRKALFLVPLLLALMGSSPPEEPPRVPSDDTLGGLHLFALDRVVVVYPAGPGENVAMNRASALARARFLEKAHGVPATVAADDTMGKDDLAQNLLVLGWNNRLLGTDAAPRPFRHSSEGLSFLGIDIPDPRADLFAFTRSPFDPTKSLAFWSRIDPERDRFVVLPALGSHWGILRDFTTIRQGMFTRPSSWPPALEPDAQKDFGPEFAAAEASETSRKSEHYDIRYDPSTLRSGDIDAIAEAREAAFARAVATLGSPGEGFRITLRVYADEAAKGPRTGIPDPAHSAPWAREIHMVPRFARSPSPHEEIHVLARKLFGPCYITSIYEGLALSEDKTYRGKDLDLHAAMMMEQGLFPSIEDLLDEEQARALPEAARFPASGLLVSWIRETAGRDALARAYSSPEPTLAALARALGQPTDSLEPTFRSWVKARSAARQAEVALRKAHAEAEERHKAGDYAGVAAAMEKALQISADDPQTLFNLASAQMRTQAYPAAEGNLKRLLALALGPKDSRFVIFGHYQLGRLYDIQGKRQQAVLEYRRMLELPDQHDAHRLAREALANPVTAGQLD